MATLIVPDEVVHQLGNVLRTSFVFAAQHFKLYTNNLTPDADTVLTDFHEATYPGYVAQAVALWSLPVRVAAGQWRLIAPVVGWPVPSAGGPYRIYGVYSTSDVDGSLAWSVRLTGAPINYGPGSAAIRAQPAYDYWQGVPP